MKKSYLPLVFKPRSHDGSIKSDVIVLDWPVRWLLCISKEHVLAHATLVSVYARIICIDTFLCLSPFNSTQPNHQFFKFTCDMELINMARNSTDITWATS